jgi:hypothetical protein
VIPDKCDRPAENVKGDAMNMCSQNPRELRTVFCMLHSASELSSAMTPMLKTKNKISFCVFFCNKIWKLYRLGTRRESK